MYEEPYIVMLQSMIPANVMGDGIERRVVSNAHIHPHGAGSAIEPATRTLETRRRMLCARCRKQSKYREGRRALALETGHRSSSRQFPIAVLSVLHLRSVTVLLTPMRSMLSSIFFWQHTGMAKKSRPLVPVATARKNGD